MVDMKRFICRVSNNLLFLSLLKKANSILFSLLATVIIHHLLTPEQKGEYAYIQNIVVILTTILNMGINLVLPSYVRKKNEWTLSTFYVLIISQFLLNCIFSVLFGIVLQSWQCFLYGLAVACGVLSLQTLNCTLIYNFKATVLANIVGIIMNVIILFIALLFNFNNIDIIFVAVIAKELLCGAICYFAVAKNIHTNEVNYREWPKIVATGIMPMLTSLLSILNYKVDILEVKWLGVSEYDIGIYSVGLGLAEYVLLMTDVFKDVLFHKTAQNDNIEYVNRSLRLCSTVLIVAYVAVIAFGKIIIRIIYGTPYLESYGVMIIVVLGTFSMMFFKLLGTLFVAQGKWYFYFFTLLGSVIINIASNIILIPIIGIYGSALTSLLSYSFAGIIFIVKYLKSYNLNLKEVIWICPADMQEMRRFVSTIKQTFSQKSN